MKGGKKDKRAVKNLKIDAEVHLALSVYCSWKGENMIDIGTKAIAEALPKLPKPVGLK